MAPARPVQDEVPRLDPVRLPDRPGDGRRRPGGRVARPHPDPVPALRKQDRGRQSDDPAPDHDDRAPRPRTFSHAPKLPGLPARPHGFR